MAIKNFWSLEAGEAMVAEAIRRKLSDWEVFFPVKDVGVDLLVVTALGTKETRVVTVQVKESKAFERGSNDITPPDTVVNWFLLNGEKVEKSQTRANFYIFVCSRYDFDAAKKTLLADYLIIPFQELVRRLRSYKAGERWDLYFCVEKDGRCLDWRGITHKNKTEEIKCSERHYSDFLNRWDKIVSYSG